VSRLANVSGREAITAFHRADFRVVRTRGDQVYMDNGTITISVPHHRIIKIGTPRINIRQANSNVEEFPELL
jgi:hypothetical protein